MPALPSDLTTVADFKAAQNITNTQDDAWIQQLITRATGWIEQQTNRKFVARQYNGNASGDATKFHSTTKVQDEDYHYFDGDWNQRDRYGYGLYYLPQYPVQENTVLAFELSVLQSRDNVNTTGDVWLSTQYLEGRDYVVDRTYGSIRLLSGPFEQGLKNFRVKYAAGYQVGGNPPWVPSDLQQLCIELVTQVYKNSAMLKSESLGTWTRSFDTQKSNPWVEGILSAYTRMVIGA